MEPWIHEGTSRKRPIPVRVSAPTCRRAPAPDRPGGANHTGRHPFSRDRPRRGVVPAGGRLPCLLLVYLARSELEGQPLDCLSQMALWSRPKLLIWPVSSSEVDTKFCIFFCNTHRNPDLMHLTLRLLFYASIPNSSSCSIAATHILRPFNIWVAAISILWLPAASPSLALWLS